MGKLLNLVTTFAGGWQKWAAIGAVFASLLLYVGWVKWDNATLETKIERQAGAITEAVRVNKENVVTIGSLIADRAEAEQVLAASHKDALRNATRASAIAKEIERVPQVENCSVGPATRSVIERMFGWPTAHPDGGEGGPASPASRTQRLRK